VSRSSGGRLSSLSIVLPAYNEQLNIEEAVRKAVAGAAAVAEDFEVIVVDDGSTDGTIEETRLLIGKLGSCVRLLSHGSNRGYGVALRTGFIHARSDYVFYTDADNQFDVAELEYFAPLMEDADVAVGFRVYRYDSTYRLVSSWGYNVLVRLLFRVRVRDVDCAFKLFRREVLDQITIESENFFVDTELIAKARKWNFRIVEKGVRHYPRSAGETTVDASDIPRTLATVLGMWRRIHSPSRKQLETVGQIREQADSAATELFAD
jgi:glycosyltransferase involved in cell wall biosynthesis